MDILEVKVIPLLILLGAEVAAVVAMIWHAKVSFKHAASDARKHAHELREWRATTERWMVESRMQNQEWYKEIKAAEAKRDAEMKEIILTNRQIFERVDRDERQT